MLQDFGTCYKTSGPAHHAAWPGLVDLGEVRTGLQNRAVLGFDAVALFVFFA
jgi:hypothetical protein